MATFSMAFPLGSGLGSALSGGVIALVGYRGMYMTLIGVLAVGLLLSLFNRAGLTTPRAPSGVTGRLFFIGPGLCLFVGWFKRASLFDGH